MAMFTGKVALITGGTGGIGRAAAVAFAGEGAAVAVSGRRRTEGDETVRLVREAGVDGLFVQCDVSRSAEVAAMVAEVETKFGRLDFAFNNAGIAPPMVPVHEQDEADFDRTIAVNLKGVWLSMKHEVPAILRAGGGAIVNNSSMGGLIAYPGFGICHATKHGVLGLTKSATLDYARQNVRVTAVCPGLILTDMMTQLAGGEDEAREFSKRQPIGRGGTPEEIAAAVVWLCSPAAALMTGHHLTLDGGLTTTTG